MNKKEWYEKNKERLRQQEKSKEFHNWRNSRILLNKLFKQLKVQKITPKNYEMFEQMFYLSKIIPLLKNEYQKTLSVKQLKDNSKNLKVEIIKFEETGGYRR